MADAPEIPEAKDPFEKRVALTIAILAIVLSFISNLGDNAKTDAIIKTNEASDQWGYFQAKGIKAQMAAMERDLMARLDRKGLSATAAPDDEVAKIAAEADRYESEKAAIKATAEGLQQQAAHQSSINDRCDQAALLLQIGVVICSVSILAGSQKFWWAGMILGAIGTILGGLAFLS